LQQIRSLSITGEFMPHRCTRCGTIFEDGDSVILSGCPSCGWNKFLYVKESEGSENQGKPALEEQTLDLESSLDEVVRNIDEALASEQEDIKQEPEAERNSDEERVESVRILGPGSYELNLDSLLERKELVMAIREEGSYALHLPSVFSQQKEKSKSKKQK
jgi:predicted  nucleic acid-binding Zn-ribbon protein